MPAYTRSRKKRRRGKKERKGKKKWSKTNLFETILSSGNVKIIKRKYLSILIYIYINPRAELLEITLLYLDKFSTPLKSRTTKFTLKIFCPIYNNFSPEERNYRLTGFNRSPSKRLQFILIYIGCDDIRAPIRSRSTHVARTIITSGLSKGDAEQQPRQHYHRTGVSVDETPAGLSSPS